MIRTPVQLALAFAAVVLWCSGTAMAFTLHIGSNSAIDGFNSTQMTRGADVPTPQMFHVVIGQNGVSPGVPASSVGDPLAGSKVRFQVVRPPQTVATHNTPQGQNTVTAHRLSGAELLLLRQVHTVAEDQSQGKARD